MSVSIDYCCCLNREHDHSDDGMIRAYLNVLSAESEYDDGHVGVWKLNINLAFSSDWINKLTFKLSFIDHLIKNILG